MILHDNRDGDGDDDHDDDHEHDDKVFTHIHSL